VTTEERQATPISAEWAIAYAFEPRYLLDILRVLPRQSRTGSRSASPFVSCWPTVNYGLSTEFNPGNDPLSYPLRNDRRPALCASLPTRLPHPRLGHSPEPGPVSPCPDVRDRDAPRA
jgi:hypothetical protein